MFVLGSETKCLEQYSHSAVERNCFCLPNLCQLFDWYFSSGQIKAPEGSGRDNLFQIPY